RAPAAGRPHGDQRALRLAVRRRGGGDGPVHEPAGGREGDGQDPDRLLRVPRPRPGEREHAVPRVHRGRDLRVARQCALGPAGGERRRRGELRQPHLSRSTHGDGPRAPRRPGGPSLSQPRAGTTRRQPGRTALWPAKPATAIVPVVARRPKPYRYCARASGVASRSPMSAVRSGRQTPPVSAYEVIVSPLSTSANRSPGARLSCASPWMGSSRPLTRTLMPDALRVWLYQAVTKLSPSFTQPTNTLSSGR